MKTRLRIPHSKEDEPLAAHADHPSHETAAPDRFGDIFAMQHTHGNAYVQRYLGALAAGKPAPGLISRDTPKGGTVGSAVKGATSGATRSVIYLTVTTANGSPIRGESKRRGREGQIECLSYYYGNAPPTNGNTKTTQKKTTQKAGSTTVTIKAQMEIHFLKYLDSASPALAQIVMTGEHVNARADVVKVDKEGRETTIQTIELKDAILSAMQPGGMGPDEETPLESLSISAEESSFTTPDPKK